MNRFVFCFLYPKLFRRADSIRFNGLSGQYHFSHHIRPRPCNYLTPNNNTNTNKSYDSSNAPRARPSDALAKATEVVYFSMSVYIASVLYTIAIIPWQISVCFIFNSFLLFLFFWSRECSCVFLSVHSLSFLLLVTLFLKIKKKIFLFVH